MQLNTLIAALLLGSMLAAGAAQAQPAGTIDRAIRAEAARLAVDTSASEGITPWIPQREPAGLSAWASVAILDAGSDVLVTRPGVVAARYRLLSVQDDGLTVLDVSSPTVPGDVAGQLRSAARSRPGVFDDARRGNEVALTSRLSIGPSGVSREGEHLFPLSLVVVDVPRTDVVEVSVIRKHVWQHIKRGMIIGAVGGGVVAGASAASCGDCGNPIGWLTAGALGGSVVGLEFGVVIGLIAPRSPDLIYRR